MGRSIFHACQAIQPKESRAIYFIQYRFIHEVFPEAFPSNANEFQPQF